VVSNHLTIYLGYEPVMPEPWYAVVASSDNGRVLAQAQGPSSLDVLREVALFADREVAKGEAE
jgi:hypothetical protein